MKTPMWRVLVVCAGLLAQAGVFAQSVAIVGGRVSTAGEAGTFEQATVLFRDGRIVAVGPAVEVPADARVIDAKGAWVTPGLFAPWSGLGLSEVESIKSPQDQSAPGAADTAAFEVAAGVNPDSMILATARQRGITRAATFPDTAKSIFAGYAALIDLAGGSAPVFESQAAAFADLGAGGAQLAGGARGASWSLVERVLAEAGRTDRPAAFAGFSERDMGAIRHMARGEVPLVVSARRRGDILHLIALKQRHPMLRLTLLHGNAAWTVAPELAAAGIPVILDSYDNLPLNFDRLQSTQQAAARLHAAGVMVALAPLTRSSSSVPHNSRWLAQLAGNAVAHGLPWEAALKAITIHPARIFGVEEELGSIEVGKLADVVVWSGDPLELSSHPVAVFVAGKAVSLQTRQTLLRDRYRDLKHPDAPAYREATQTVDEAP